MTYATPADHPNILQLFKTYKSVFPYLRTDYLTRKIVAGTVIWDSGVVMIYSHCKVNRTLSGIKIHHGDIMLSEMATKTPGSGAASLILQQFLKDFPTTIWLTVRVDNTRACAFYEKHNMCRVGDIAWSGGTIPGYIYCHPKPLDIPLCL